VHRAASRGGSLERRGSLREPIAGEADGTPRGAHVALTRGAAVDVQAVSAGLDLALGLDQGDRGVDLGEKSPALDAAGALKTARLGMVLYMAMSSAASSCHSGSDWHILWHIDHDQW
jgi:hypothetical protein